MVKSYDRFELEATFGIVSSGSSVALIRGTRTTPGQAVVGAGEAVQVWELKTGELVARLWDSQQPPKAQVVHVAYEPASELIAAGYTDGSVRVWDLRSQAVLVVFQGHRSAVSCVRFSADGTQLVSGSADTTVIVWDLVNEQGLYRLKGHKAMITAVLLIGDRLVSTAKDGVVKVWDLSTQFATETRVAHKGECWAATLLDAPDGTQRLATLSNGTELKLWAFDAAAAEGQQLRALGSLEKVTKSRGVALAYAKGVLYCASGDAVQLWKQRSPEELKKVLRRKEKRKEKKRGSDEASADAEGDANAAEVELSVADEFVAQPLVRTKSKISGLALGHKLLVTNSAANAVEAWTADGERRFAVDRAGHRSDVRDAAVSSDGHLVATGANGSIKVYNATTHGVVRTLIDTGYILALAFLPGNALLAAATKEGTLDVYDLARAERITSVDAHGGQAVWALDLAADGTQLVTGGADKCAKFWAIKPSSDGLSLKNTHKIEFSDDVLAVKFSPDMRFVAASLLDSTVKVYFRDTLKFYLNLYGHALPVLSLDISHDSKLLVTSSADKSVKVWGLDFGDMHKSIFAHDDAVLRVRFLPGQHNFVSSSKDALVKIWDGTKFVQIQRLVGHHSEVWALAVAPDGSYIVSASHDKTVRLWEATDEPLFVEEEREAELEEQHEQTLLESLDRDARDAGNSGGAADGEDGEEDGGEAESVARHTSDSLKAGERLYEALEIATVDLEERPSPRHVVLAALDVSAERYLLDVLARIKAPIVEDALLTFPLDRIAKLLTFVRIWLERRWQLALVARVLFFCVRTFHRQLVANRMLLPELEQIRALLRGQLDELATRIGTNVAEMRWISEMWDEAHVKVLPAEEEKKAKRVYASVA